jgi:hypothetical protein
VASLWCWHRNRDRFAREPAYHYLLWREFEEHGTKIRALNDRGDDSLEGELTDGILDQIAKFERAKTAERTRRGRLRRAREGKIIPGRMPNYGFRYDATGDSYEVNETTMPVVRRIFDLIVESASVNGSKKKLEAEGIPNPRRKVRAEPLEEQVWALVSEVLLEPERLKRGLRKMVEKERSVLRGNPEEEAKTWAKRLAEVERKRSSFQDMAAEGLITLEELRAKLNSLEETRKVARTELDALASRSERVAAIERDAEAVLRDYAGLMPEALATMAPEDRHRVYKMLRLKILVYPDGSGELRGMFGQGMSVGPLEITSGSSSGSTHDATGRCGGR